MNQPTLVMMMAPGPGTTIIQIADQHSHFGPRAHLPYLATLLPHKKNLVSLAHCPSHISRPVLLEEGIG